MAWLAVVVPVPDSWFEHHWSWRTAVISVYVVSFGITRQLDSDSQGMAQLDVFSATWTQSSDMQEVEPHFY